VLGRCEERGHALELQLETTDIGFAEEPVLNHRLPRGKAEEAYPARFRLAEGEICFFWQECRTNEKALRPEILLEKCANPNRRAPGRRYSLGRCRTIQSGSKDVVEQIIAAGADVKHKNKQGKTAEMLAIENNHTDLAELLGPGR
jgi:hypothetical protein